MADARKKIERAGECRWIIPRSGDMKVPVVIYSSEKLLDKAINDNATSQLENVASLRGIERWALGMPDVHWGYGAPIGGVGAFDPNPE